MLHSQNYTKCLHPAFPASTECRNLLYFTLKGTLGPLCTSIDQMFTLGLDRLEEVRGRCSLKNILGPHSLTEFVDVWSDCYIPYTEPESF